jgi:hypothetical protein
MMELLIVLVLFVLSHVILGRGLYQHGLEVGMRYSPAPKVIDKTERRPVCLCEHGSNFHKDGTGRCTQTLNWELRGDILGLASVVDKRVGCRCLQYTGPTPLPLVYHPAELEK